MVILCTWGLSSNLVLSFRTVIVIVVTIIVRVVIVIKMMMMMMMILCIYINTPAKYGSIWWDRWWQTIKIGIPKWTRRNKKLLIHQIMEQVPSPIEINATKWDTKMMDLVHFSGILKGCSLHGKKLRKQHRSKIGVEAPVRVEDLARWKFSSTRSKRYSSRRFATNDWIS